MTVGEDPSREAGPAALPGGPPAADETSLPASDIDSRAGDGSAESSRSFAEDLRDLAGDAQTLFDAEKAYERARLSYALSRGKGVALSFVLAGVLVYFATIAAVVGLLLALAPLLTAWGALAVVTLGLALFSFLFFRSGMKRLRRMRTFLGAGAVGAAAGGAST
jgi:pilus assembly protein TadC